MGKVQRKRERGKPSGRKPAGPGKWTIYCHTHIESGKRYIGQTKFTMEYRWRRGHVPTLARRLGAAAAFAELAVRSPGLGVAVEGRDGVVKRRGVGDAQRHARAVQGPPVGERGPHDGIRGRIRWQPASHADAGERRGCEILIGHFSRRNHRWYFSGSARTLASSSPWLCAAYAAR